MSGFEEIPVLDWDLITSGPESRAKFIWQLRDAMTKVGFLYLLNPPVGENVAQSVIDYAPKLFDMPQETKDKLLMVNNESFFGYNKLGAEITKGTTDYREQFDFGTPSRGKTVSDGPTYRRLWGQSQWPSDSDLPGFQTAYTEYLLQVEDLSFKFIALLAEALGLPPNEFDRFFDKQKEAMVHRSKVVKYPVLPPGSSDQGVGPHFDGGFLTFLLQASPHPGLQAQNEQGEWVSASPRPRTLVVNSGKALETVTRGLVRATSHRVLATKGGNGSEGAKPFRWSTDGLSEHPVGARYSIPFFQSISQDIRVSDNILEFPQDVPDTFDTQNKATSESVNFSEYAKGEPSGYVQLIGRIKSHPDVGERHYPKEFKEIFPNGAPAQGIYAN